MNVRLFVALCHNLQWAVIQIPVAEEWMVLFRSSRGTRHAFTPSTPQYGRWTTPRTASSRGQAQPRGGHSQIPKQLLPAGQEEASSRGQNRPHKPRTRHLQKKTGPGWPVFPGWPWARAHHCPGESGRAHPCSRVLHAPQTQSKQVKFFIFSLPSYHRSRERWAG